LTSGLVGLSGYRFAAQYRYVLCDVNTIRPHRMRITDAAYCYKENSVVSVSVCWFSGLKEPWSIARKVASLRGYIGTCQVDILKVTREVAAGGDEACSPAQLPWQLVNWRLSCTENSTCEQQAPASRLTHWNVRELAGCRVGWSSMRSRLACVLPR